MPDSGHSEIAEIVGHLAVNGILLKRGLVPFN